MTYMPRTFIILTLFFCSLHASAHAGGLSGRVVAHDGKAVDAANVVLFTMPDSTVVGTAITDAQGEFALTPLADGAYVLKVLDINHQTYTSPKITIGGNSLVLPDITLVQLSSDLKEVAIRSQKPFIEVHSDKIVVNVENSIVSAGGSALDVLAHSPGVSVDQSDNVSLKGKQGVTIMINGRIQPMTGQDLANVLKSMPAESIGSIELISNPSSRYDAAGTAGIINIKTRKDNKAGLNGSVNGTYAQGVYGKSNGGISMNYRNKRFNIFGNYNRSDREGFNHLTLDRNFYTGGLFSGAYLQDNHYLYHIRSNTAGLGMDYTISKATTIGFVANSENTYFRRDGYNYSNIIDSGQMDSMKQHPSAHFTTQNSAPNKWGNYAANINLRHVFDSTGKSLGIDADYATYPSDGKQDYTTTYFKNLPDGSFQPSGLPQSILRGDLKGVTRIRSIKADYSGKMGNGVKTDAGLKTSYVTADNDLHYYNYIDSIRAFVPDGTRTNHFMYNEMINAAYVNAGKEWTKWNLQIGLRVEQTLGNGHETTTDSTFSRNYAQLFPSVAAQRHLDNNNDLGITLSRRIERPNYEQLNPFKYYLDPTTYKSGYPYLSPALSYSAELSYIFKQKFVTNLNYTLTSLPITEVIQPSTTETKVTIQTTKNLTSMAYYGISGAYQFQLRKWWNNTTNINAYYARYTGDIAGTNLNAGKATFDVNTTNSFLLPAGCSAELSFNYEAPQVYGYMHLMPTWMLNVGVQKNLFDKRATLRLNATDIFWHGYPRATSYYNDYVESFTARRDTRQISISFSWRFGKRTVPQSVRHNGGAEDEKRRAGGQSG